jgi:hypothetical protein
VYKENIRVSESEEVKRVAVAHFSNGRLSVKVGDFAKEPAIPSIVAPSDTSCGYITIFPPNSLTLAFFTR